MSTLFWVCPRDRNVDLAVRAFGYVKTALNNQIAIDSRSMKLNRSSPTFENVIPDFVKDYPGAKEEIYPSFPSTLGQ